jgi:hypothetical protein
MAAVGLALALLHATSVIVGESADSQTEPSDKFEMAATARRLAPWRADALALMAISALETGHRNAVLEAAEELDEFRWLRPRSAALADLRGRLDQALGHGPSAAEEAWIAATAHPSNPTYQNRMEKLFHRLRGEHDE